MNVGDLQTASIFTQAMNILDALGNLTAQSVIPLLMKGIEADAVDFIMNGYLSSTAMQVNRVSIYTPDPPTGQDLILSLYKDDVVEAQTITLAAGANEADITLGTPIPFSVVQRLGAKFTQVGSTNAGSDMFVTIHTGAQ
jgi:hypothetical protein